jgi:hypothetical protein
MSRVFKPKKVEPSRDVSEPREMVLKPPTQLPQVKEEPSKGITLVEATPVKPRAMSRTQSLFGQRAPDLPAMGSILIAKQEEEEEIWDLPSSPDILLLGADGFNSDEEDDEGHVLVHKTPSRKR